MQLHGSWQDAVAESQQACEQFSQTQPQAGGGRRLLPSGRNLPAARPVRRGRRRISAGQPIAAHAQPGLAQLRFAQGQLDAANVAIRRVLEELVEPAARASALDATLKSCWPPKMSLRRGPPPANCRRSRAASMLHCSMPCQTAPWALCPWRKGTRKRRWPSAAILEHMVRTRSALRGCAGPRADGARVPRAGRSRRRGPGTRRSVPDLPTTGCRACSRLRGGALAKKLPDAGSLTEREVQVLKLVASGRTNRAIASQARNQRKDSSPPPQQYFQQARSFFTSSRHRLRLPKPISVTTIHVGSDAPLGGRAKLARDFLWWCAKTKARASHRAGVRAPALRGLRCYIKLPIHHTARHGYFARCARSHSSYSLVRGGESMTNKTAQES